MKDAKPDSQESTMLTILITRCSYKNMLARMKLEYNMHCMYRRGDADNTEMVWFYKVLLWADHRAVQML